MGYRAHLDGLRGIAIALVLAQHFIGSPEGAGTVGVGIFFALSGYLITGLLLDEHTQHGRINLFAFYARRAGRLVPGLVVCVVVTAPLLAQTWLPVVTPALSALTYTTNFGLIFGWLNMGSDPYLQTWSLAIEEHFYLLWAPVLMLAVRRHGAKGVLQAALLGVALSVMWRFDVAAFSGDGMWISTDSLGRGDALLIGCAAAAAVRLGYRPPRWLLGPSVAVLGLLLVTPTLGAFHPAKSAVSYGLLSLASAGLVVGVESSRFAQRLLSLRPLVWTGVISYSIYLWHVPLMNALGGTLPVWAIFVVSMVAAVASYRLVERPVRTWVRRAVDRRSVDRQVIPTRTAVVAASS